MTLSREGDVSLNVIVIAAISVIVLVVLVVIFSGKLGAFNQCVKDCYSKGGEPSSRTEPGKTCWPIEFEETSEGEAPEPKLYCCLT
jgi:hypothetical protein